EVLLVALPVVHRHRLAGPEDGEIDPELLEVERTLEAGALELAEHAAALALPPLRVACAKDEPALSLRDEAVLGAHELRLGRHRPTMPPRMGRQQRTTATMTRAVCPVPTSTAARRGCASQPSRRGSGRPQSDEKSSSTIVAPGAASARTASGSSFARPPSTKMRSNGACAGSTSRQSPCRTSTSGSSAKSC